MMLLVMVLLSAILPIDKGPHDIMWGMRNGADAKVRYRVIDSEGSSIDNGEITVFYRTDYPKLKKWSVNLLTDTNGCFVAEGHLNQRIGIRAFKEGYYYSWDSVELRETKSAPAIVDGKWQPYGESRTIVLKPQRNPIEMPGIEKYGDIAIPQFNSWMAFDLEKMTWLPPNGDGEYADVLLRFTLEEGRNKYWDYRATMEMSFTNSAYAGAYVRNKDQSSELKCGYAVDTNQTFATYFKYSIDGGSADGQSGSRLNDDLFMVFRTRTKTDDRGRLVSAHYGKILGDVSFKKVLRVMSSSFNTTPNDINLEDYKTYRGSQIHRKNELELRRKE